MAKKKMDRESMGEYTRRCYDIDHLVYIREDREIQKKGKSMVVNVPVAFREMTPVEEETVHKYIRETIYAVAIKKRVLNHVQDYDIFVDDLTEFIFNRMIRKDIDFSVVYGEDEEVDELIAEETTPKKKRKIGPIQSSKNTIEFLVNKKSVDFAKEQNKISISFNSKYAGEREKQAANAYFKEASLYEIGEEAEEAYNELYSNIDKYINKVLNESIFKNDIIRKNNLELSIKLSLLNVLILNVTDAQKEFKKQMNIILKQCDNIENYIILWDKDTQISKDNVLFYIRKLFVVLNEEFNSIESSRQKKENNINMIFDPGFFGGLSNYDYEE